MPENKYQTLEQAEIATEFMEHHGLEFEQIAFEGASNEPIFNYEALNLLRLKLTDLKSVDPEVVERNETLGIVSVKCSITLADGRIANDIGSCKFRVVNPDDGELISEGDRLFDGTIITSQMDAQNVAMARALRRALRSAGINLLKAHKKFTQSGEVESGDLEFKNPIGREIHKLATDWGHIKEGDKHKYQDFIENMFGTGKRSSLDLNDIEKSQLQTTYRQMLNSRGKAGLKKAA